MYLYKLPNVFEHYLYLKYIFPDKNLLGPTLLARCRILLCIHLQNSWCKCIFCLISKFEKHVFNYCILHFTSPSGSPVSPSLTPPGSSLPAFSYQFACSPLAVGKTGTDCSKPWQKSTSDYWLHCSRRFPTIFPKSKIPPNCLRELTTSHYCCPPSPSISPNPKIASKNWPLQIIVAVVPREFPQITWCWISWHMPFHRCILFT